MDLGGVETWLMHLLRTIDRDRFKFDFLYHTNAKSDYDEEIKRLGARIFRLPFLSNPFIYSRKLTAILKQYGPYDVVHSHDISWNGLVLATAKKADISVRIAHSHNDYDKSRPRDVLRRIFIEYSRYLTKNYATDGLACSHLAARSYWGPGWPKDRRWRVYYCGLDFSAYKTNSVRDLRDKLGLSGSTFVVGHIGSFRDRQKNHSFIIDIVKEVVSREKSVSFLLIGDGVLRNEIEEKCSNLGLQQHVRFLGLRTDIPDLLRCAMDILLFPSLYEGLGLVLVEAQAAGLRCLCSDVIPKEAGVVPELITRLSLSRSAVEWAMAILDMKNSQPSISHEQALESVCSSHFNLENGMDELVSIYSKNA
jgi:glycosyltransferase involved in cell wall biosynthesis